MLRTVALSIPSRKTFLFALLTPRPHPLIALRSSNAALVMYNEGHGAGCVTRCLAYAHRDGPVPSVRVLHGRHSLYVHLAQAGREPSGRPRHLAHYEGVTTGDTSSPLLLQRNSRSGLASPSQGRTRRHVGLPDLNATDRRRQPAGHNQPDGSHLRNLPYTVCLCQRCSRWRHRRSCESGQQYTRAQ